VLLKTNHFQSMLHGLLMRFAIKSGGLAILFKPELRSSPFSSATEFWWKLFEILTSARRAAVGCFINRSKATEAVTDVFFSYGRIRTICV